MLINFKIKNFGSYRQEQVLSFEKKSKEKSYKGFIKKIKDLEILKTVGLVGVNGSGKTFLLGGIDFMKAMVLQSHTHNIDTKINYNTYILDNEKPIGFEITFISEGKKYIYGFSYTNEKIIKEYAKVYETQKPSVIFSRNNQKFKFNEKYEKELKPLSDSVIPKTLMVSRAVQLNSEILKSIYDFFTKIYIINSTIIQNMLFNIQPNFLSLKNEKLKEELLEKLYNVDFSIKDLKLVKYAMTPVEIPNESSSKKDSLTLKIQSEIIENLNLIHEHKNKKLQLNFSVESIGTQKFISIFYNLLKLSKDSVILFDEIENSFNIEIVKFIIDYFAINENNYQLLFTTHQPDILNYLRSDQINIIEKEDLTSQIINLHDIVKNNPKINKNYGDYYREGVLGGFPRVYKEIN